MGHGDFTATATYEGTEYNIGAFSLGIFDSYCVNRHRPITMTANITEVGDYKVIIDLNSCANEGLSIGPRFYSTCDSTMHTDSYALTCDEPTVIFSDTIEISVVERETRNPYFEVSGLETEYETGDDITATINVKSDGDVDRICGVSYEISKDGEALTDLSEYGTLSYSVRLVGTEDYTNTVTAGAGNIVAEAAYEGTTYTVGAFSLGIFDSECVNRNRPITMNANITEAGEYKVIVNLNSCTNEGVRTNSSFTSTCDHAVHYDMVATTCEGATMIFSDTMTIVVREPEAHNPYFEVSGLETEYETGDDITATINVKSDGDVDRICGVSYEISKDGEALTDLSEYGTLSYSVRLVGTEDYTNTVTAGAGNIVAEAAYEGTTYTVGAFSLGIFDSECVNRNRPITMNANITEAGEYKVIVNLNSCTNEGVRTNSSFTSTCDHAVHYDMVATTCEGATMIFSDTMTIVVREPVVEEHNPYFEISDIASEYEVNTDIPVEVRVMSDGDVDRLCGVSYEISKDGEVIESISDYGTVTYGVRLYDQVMFNDTVTNGSGTIHAVAEYENETYTIEAFSLGIFDNECVNRNRPINLTANIREAGEYSVTISLNSCSNEGSPMGTSFTSTCDGELHNDMIATTCDNPVSIFDTTITITVREPETETPHFVISEVASEYEVNTDIPVEVRVMSAGQVDRLCGVSYEISKDGEVIESISDYGTVTYGIRLYDQVMFNDTVTNGSGTIHAVAEYENETYTIEAFSLGIFDNECVNRNRPINLNANIREAGEYSVTISLNSCSNEGTPMGTSFTSTCDGELHNDMIATTCDNPVSIFDTTITITVREPETETPHFVISEVASEYEVNTDIPVEVRVMSAGQVDRLCGVSYEISKDGEVIESISDYGTVTYGVRLYDQEMFTDDVTEGSGTIHAEAEYEGTTYNIEGFTLGIFDNECVNRNRPININANIREIGTYSVTISLNSCSNEGSPMGTSFTSTCDGEVHYDMIAETCDNPVAIFDTTITFEVVNTVVELGPRFEVSEISDSTATNTDIPVQINILSGGQVDRICSVTYSMYKDDEAIESVSDYGTVSYGFRLTDNVYFNDTMRNGAGTITTTFNGHTIEGFSLGIFDSECAHRNRPININANMRETGVYSVIVTLNGCSNTGDQIGTSFESSCDDSIHYDMIAQVCENPVALYVDTITIDIRIDEISTYTNEGSIEVYPNPTADFVNVVTTGMNVNRIELLNVEGQILMAKEIVSESEVISLESQVTGMYFLRIYTDDEIFVRKVTKF